MPLITKDHKDNGDLRRQGQGRRTIATTYVGRGHLIIEVASFKRSASCDDDKENHGDGENDNDDNDMNMHMNPSVTTWAWPAAYNTWTCAWIVVRHKHNDDDNDGDSDDNDDDNDDDAYDVPLLFHYVYCFYASNLYRKSTTAATHTTSASQTMGMARSTCEVPLFRCGTWGYSRVVGHLSCGDFPSL